jgi:hypothetical protein
MTRCELLRRVVEEVVVVEEEEEVKVEELVAAAAAAWLSLPWRRAARASRASECSVL